MIGNFKNTGQEWQEKGNPIDVNAYDFESIAESKATPYGVYDITKPAWPEQIIRSHRRMIEICTGYQGFTNF